MRLMNLRFLKNDKVKATIARYMKHYIRFNYELVNVSTENNDFRLYDSFAEILYFLSTEIDIKQEDKDALILQMSIDLLNIYEKEHGQKIIGDNYQHAVLIKQLLIISRF